MTLDQLRKVVKDYCNLPSDTADVRISRALNRHYRRITSTLNLESSRFVTRTVTTTIGVQTVQFTEIEKIDRLLDTSDSAVRLLTEVELHVLRSATPGTANPCTWALQSTEADAVTVRLDTVPQSTYTLQADGWTTLSDLGESDEPVFPESFHDILTWFVIAEELLKKEKAPLAAAYEAKAEKLLAELRHHLVDSPTRVTRQDRSSTSSALTGGGGGSALGGTSYTESALVTYDRGAGLAPFAVAQATAAKVSNLDADKLDGEDGTFYLDRANHTGTSLHASTHQNGGSDEISVTGLSGLLADGQTPLAHKTSHQSGGSDAIKLDDLSAPDDNTDLNASTSAHGLLKKLSGTATEFLNGTGSFSTPSSVAGSTTQVQYNDAGTLAGDADFTFDKSTNTLAVPQVQFPATQSASTNANTLDDYEEGTWTPIDSSGAALSFGSVLGHYVKIGQLVQIWGFITFPSTGNGSAVIIGGLPFTSQTVTTPIYCGLVANNAGAVAGLARVLSASTTFSVVRVTATGTAMANSDYSGVPVTFSFSYRASA